LIPYPTSWIIFGEPIDEHISWIDTDGTLTDITLQFGRINTSPSLETSDISAGCDVIFAL
jgi:hypothetical protein